MVTHVPVPLVLLSNKQVDLFKSSPDAAPIDFLNAAWLGFQIHLFQTIKEKVDLYPISKLCLLFLIQLQDLSLCL